IYAVTFISSSDHRTISAGVPSDLIPGDLVQWGAIAAAVLIPTIPLALLYNAFLNRFIAGFTGGWVPSRGGSTLARRGAAKADATAVGATATRVTRRELLKRAGVGVAAVGVAGSGASKAFAFAGPHRHTGRWLSGDLKILQWVHFVPAYDQWFDNTWIKNWGENNDVNVSVDHIVNTQLDARAASEVAAQSGHDLFQFLAPPAIYEDQVINHNDIIAEIQKKVGKYSALGKASTYNPTTKKYI